MIEVDQFGFRQLVNVDHHEASPSALNGVSTLQRPARSGQVAARGESCEDIRLDRSCDLMRKVLGQPTVLESPQPVFEVNPALPPILDPSGVPSLDSPAEYSSGRRLLARGHKIRVSVSAGRAVWVYQERRPSSRKF